MHLKIKPNSVRIRSLSCQMFVLPSTGFERCVCSMRVREITQCVCSKESNYTFPVWLSVSFITYNTFYNKDTAMLDNIQ